MKIRVLIMPKEGLLDPEGRAVKEMLIDNGYSVKDVKVGKVVELELDETAPVKEIVEKYIVNPLIQDYFIQE